MTLDPTKFGLEIQRSFLKSRIKPDKNSVSIKNLSKTTSRQIEHYVTKTPVIPTNESRSSYNV